MLNVRRDLGVRLVRRLGVWGLGVGLIGIISDILLLFFFMIFYGMVYIKF